MHRRDRYNLISFTQCGVYQQRQELGYVQHDSCTRCVTSSNTKLLPVVRPVFIPACTCKLRSWEKLKFDLIKLVIFSADSDLFFANFTAHETLL